MSQILNFGMGGIPPAGPILRLTGDIGGPVEPTGGNINIIGEGAAPIIGFATVEGSPGTSTLGIFPLTATVTSNDATFTTLYSLPLDDNSGAFLQSRIIGIKSDFTDAAGGGLIGIAHRQGAGATSVPKQGGAVLSDKLVGPFPSGRIINVGNTMEIQVRGSALGDVYRWTAHIEYQLQL